MRASQLDLPEKIQENLKNELGDGERITWAKQPRPRLFSPKMLSLSVFGAVWIAFSLFWMVGANQSGGFTFSLFGIPFLLLGIVMLLSPIWGIVQSNNTLYLVSSQRALILVGITTVTVQSFYAEDLQEISRVERKNNLGDLIFFCREWVNAKGRKQSENIGFMNIENPKEVERLIGKLVRKGEVY